MADNRTMAQMLQAPIEGYEDAIVVPPINANNFELKQPLINLVQSNKFTGRQDPHNHLRFFNKVTSTFRHPEVPNTSIKLLLFPFSLDGEARDWLDKEPPRSILTWTNSFNEAWERFKGLLRQCPHHGFSELHQLDTFYNSLNSNDQDALDSAAGGNFLDKMPQEGLAIIESKSKVRYSRSRASDSRVSTDAPLSNSSSSNNSFDMQQIAASLEDKMTIKMNQMMNQMKALVVTTPAPVKAVEENYTKLLKDLCANKEKLEELANTPLSENCSAVILENCQTILRTHEALIDVYDEKLILRDGNESLTLNMQSEKSKLNGIQKVESINMIDIFNVPNYIGFKDLFAQMYSGNPTIQSNDSFSSSSPMKTSDSTFKEFTDKFTLPNSSPPGDDVSILKNDFQEETFRIISNPLFEFDESFKSSNVNPLFEENNKDVEIMLFFSITHLLHQGNVSIHGN
ncbi:hypothetical protein Tco_0353140 [Tanacetum coccineum]